MTDVKKFRGLPVIEETTVKIGRGKDASESTVRKVETAHGQMWINEDGDTVTDPHKRIHVEKPDTARAEKAAVVAEKSTAKAEETKVKPDTK